MAAVTVTAPDDLSHPHSSLWASSVFCLLDKYLLSTCVVGAGAAQIPTQQGRTGGLSHRHSALSWQLLLGIASAEDSCLAWMTRPSQRDPCQRTNQHRDLKSGPLLPPWDGSGGHPSSQIPVGSAGASVETTSHPSFFQSVSFPSLPQA